MRLVPSSPSPQIIIISIKEHIHKKREKENVALPLSMVQNERKKKELDYPPSRQTRIEEENFRWRMI